MRGGCLSTGPPVGGPTLAQPNNRAAKMLISTVRMGLGVDGLQVLQAHFSIALCRGQRRVAEEFFDGPLNRHPRRAGGRQRSGASDAG